MTAFRDAAGAGGRVVVVDEDGAAPGPHAARTSSPRTAP
jgi:hypothetical protein